MFTTRMIPLVLGTCLVLFGLISLNNTGGVLEAFGQTETVTGHWKQHEASNNISDEGHWVDSSTREWEEYKMNINTARALAAIPITVGLLMLWLAYYSNSY